MQILNREQLREERQNLEVVLIKRENIFSVEVWGNLDPTKFFFPIEYDNYDEAYDRFADLINNMNHPKKTFTQDYMKVGTSHWEAEDRQAFKEETMFEEKEKG